MHVYYFSYPQDLSKAKTLFYTLSYFLYNAMKISYSMNVINKILLKELRPR